MHKSLHTATKSIQLSILRHDTVVTLHLDSPPVNSPKGIGD